MSKKFTKHSMIRSTVLLAALFLSSAPSFAAQFNLGERVTHPTYGVGSVRDAEGDTISVEFENYGEQAVDASALSTQINCTHDVCKDFQVDNDMYGAGTVTEVFSDGTSNVEFDDYGTTLVNTRSLAVTAQAGDQLEALHRAQLAEQTERYSGGEDEQAE